MTKIGQRLKCPVCNDEGTLMRKDTTTFAKGRQYHYRKLYVYHGQTLKRKKQKWCYLDSRTLEALAVENDSRTTQKPTQNTTAKKSKKSGCFSQKQRLAGPTGIEPVAYGLRVRRSNLTELRARLLWRKNLEWESI